MAQGADEARPTTGEPTDLGMAGAVQGGEANTGRSGAFDGQLSAAAARRAGIDDGFQPSAVAYWRTTTPPSCRAMSTVPVAGFHRERRPGVAYPDIGEFWRQPDPVDVVLVGPQLLDGVAQVPDNYGYSAQQPRPRAGRGVVLAALLPGGVGAVYNEDYALQPRPDAEHGDVPVHLLPNDAGHGQAFGGQLPGGGVDAAYDDYGYYALQPRSGAGLGEVLVDLLPNGARHGQFVDLLPGGGSVVHDDNGYYLWQPRPRAGRGEEFLGPLPDGVGAVFINSGNFVQQAPPGTGRAEGIAGALHGRRPGAGHDGSQTLAGAAYNNLSTVAEHLRRLLPFAGICACSVAVNGLAAGSGSPAVAFDLFALFLGGLLLVILHVLRA